MSALGDHLAASGAQEAELAPSGGVEQTGDRLVVTTRQRQEEPSEREWRALLEEWGYEFDEWVPDVGQTATVKGYEVAHKDEDGEAVITKLRSWQLRLRRREPHEADPIDVDKLRAAIAKKKPRKAAAAAVTAAAVIALSDWQTGKGEGGGSAATVERVQDAVLSKAAWVRSVKPSTVCLATLGDLAENCTGFYADQLSSIDLNRREQMQVNTSLLLWIVDQFIQVPRIVITGVPSNHGENRSSKGKAITDPFRDNLDLELMDRVGQVLAGNPDRYGHVELIVPNQEFPEVCTVELDGAWLATHHGHFRGPGSRAIRAGSKRMDTALNWLAFNFLNKRGAAGADMLLFGHGHHLIVSEESNVPAMQVPAMDGGSEWFSANTGIESPPGMVSFLFGDSLRPERVYREIRID